MLRLEVESKVYQPDGSVLSSIGVTSAETINLPNLPTTGTYTLYADPYYGETLSAQLTLGLSK